ncbi:hypothetical protein [Euzebya tangerina]|uniref:hypothetical protein n=1 Tax=Euzebya tangerina TaxID=591198 RepID=UPI000E3213DE|nr:hypothetical protein [Euzebya tangerina]
MTATPSDPNPTASAEPDQTPSEPTPEAQPPVVDPAPSESAPPELPAQSEGAADSEAATEPATTEPPAVEPDTTGDTGPVAEPPADQPAQAEQAAKPEQPAKAEQQPKKKKKKKKAPGPDPAAVIRTIGTTSEAALAYVQNPDATLSRMARKHREVVITDIPPVTAGALLGPAALCRHFLASAATGRYRDLFYLWDLFTLFPEECKGVLAQRQIAQEKAKKKLRTATHLGLLGDAGRVAEDIDRAAGLPWRWMKEILEPMGPAIRRRPVVMAALSRRDTNYEIEVPEDPSDEWLAEAAAMRDTETPIPDAIDAVLGAHADRLPATVPTLTMAQSEYPDRVPALIDRVDLDADDVGAILAWARDHGHGDQLTGRITRRVEEAAATDRAAGLAEWKTWNDRGVDVALPESVQEPNLVGLDIGRPETADLVKILIEGGADLDAQEILDAVASENRMRGEKAFENFVCAGFDSVHLPLALEGNPMVRAETRCPACQAWTWVRPGHETRCPRLEWSPGATVDVDGELAAAVDAAVAGIDSGAAGEPPAADTPAVSAAPRPAAAPPAASAVETPATEPQPPAAEPESVPAADDRSTQEPTPAPSDGEAPPASGITTPEPPAASDATG